ncbi:MAG: UDP-3-O-(3-hydroxymyristoyl)glucosamine N-acyltransferase [Planctomycetota bacterium]|nr:MAG: UDP-3-O-(3-hydroxymyristoyl)glucosamine N-acyltransferase [Planctomycetota bacterium]
MQVTVAQVAEFLGGKVVGDPQVKVSGISSLAEAKPGDISFLANPRYEPMLEETAASAVLVAKASSIDRVSQIVVPNPDYAFAQVVERYGPQPRPVKPGVHPTAVIGEDVQLGEGVSIGAYAVVGDGSVIGDGCRLYPHSVVGDDCQLGPDCCIYPHVTVREGCILGARVFVHSGAVIGSDGFGYASVEGVHHKIPQVGIVVVGDDVEIGANTAIDRARFGKTIIGSGTKIDNLVQVAHNVEIGQHCIIVAQVGIAGSTTLGHHVTMAGQVGVVGHLHIGDQAVIAARAGVSKNVPAKAVVAGTPAKDVKMHHAQEVAARRLPRLHQTVKALEQRLAELEQRLGEGSGS